jgi:hypothetical protein
MNTGLKEMPVVNIPVSIYVTADVEATPATLILPLAIPKGMQRLVYVRNYVDKMPMKVTQVKVSNPEIKTELTEPQTGVAWRISVDVPKDFKLAPAGETLTIITDSPTVPELIIPIKQAGTMMANPTPAVGGVSSTATAAPATAQPVPASVQGNGKYRVKPATNNELPAKPASKP